MASSELYSRSNFRLVIQKPSGDNDIFYPQIISGNCTDVYPFAVPTARFVVSTNSTLSTSAYLSPIRDDDIVRFQVNHKFFVGEADVWIDVFEGRVSGINSVFNSNENTTTIKCIGHGESLKYTSTPTTVGHTAKTTGFILETLMPAMARISDDDTLIDITGSTSISQFDLKEDSQKIMDVVRDLESLELYGYIFRLKPLYDTDGVLTSVEPVWEAISSTATDKLIINESAQSFISASFKSNISKMRNRFTIYSGSNPQVSATVNDTALQATYDIREELLVNKSITTTTMCTNIATAALARWKNPIISGTITIRGNPYIKVGDRVTCNIPSIIINGDPIDDTYLVYKVTHNINDGYTTRLELGEIDISTSELITSLILGNRRNNLNSAGEDPTLLLNGSNEMTGSLPMGANKIANLGTPTVSTDAATKQYVDDNAGGVTNHGALTGLADDDHSQYYNATRHTKAVHDALNIDADTLDGLNSLAFVKSDGSVGMSGNLDLNSNKIVDIGTPSADTDAATKGYVDSLPGVDGISFIIDQDNAGAGVSSSLRFNRGSTDGDAAIWWDEADDEFQFESDVGVTRGKLNVQLVKMVSEPTNHKTGTIQMNDSTGDMEFSVAAGDSFVFKTV